MKESEHFGFYQTSRQNYWEDTRKYNDFTDEVMFGIYEDKGGITCELFMRWYELGGKSPPRFEMCLASIPPMEAQTLLRIIQSALDLGDDPSPEDFCKCLTKLGFKDLSDNPPE